MKLWPGKGEWGGVGLTVFSALWMGATAVFTAGVMWLGQDYYPLDLEARSHHEMHALLSPGGGLGVLMGLVGTGLMVIMMTYSIRRALGTRRYLGSLANWLRFHIACGLAGPWLIVLHAGWSWPSGLIAVGFWCMVLVALSGIFGRYFYGLIPRAAAGKALAWDQALGRLQALRAELVARTEALDPTALGPALAAASDFDQQVVGLSGLIRLNRELARRQRVVRKGLSDAGLEGADFDYARDALESQLELKRSMEASTFLRQVVRYWHLFHRPLAGAMYVLACVHIASAVLFGGSLQALSTLFGG